MNAEIINPFLQAAAMVFKQVMGLNLLLGRSTVRTNPRPQRDVGILVGVEGSMHGMAVYGMNIETCYKVVRKVMPELDMAQVRSEYRDVLGEVGNMITGNALKSLVRQNPEIDLTVPMVVDARTSPPDLKDKPTLSMNLYSRIGILEVNISLHPG